MSLTVAGAAACDGTEQVLQVVVAAARLAADAYLSGDPAEPGVTFDQVLAHLAVEVPPEGERELARRSGMLLVQEPWSVQTNVNESGWTIKVDRGIRPYAGVETVEQYWRARQEQLAAEQDQVAGQIWAGASLNGDPSPVPDEQVSTSGESVQTDPSAPASPVDEDAPANSGPPLQRRTPTRAPTRSWRSSVSLADCSLSCSRSSRRRTRSGPRSPDRSSAC